VNRPDELARDRGVGGRRLRHAAGLVVRHPRVARSTEVGHRIELHDGTPERLAELCVAHFSCSAPVVADRASPLLLADPRELSGFAPAANVLDVDDSPVADVDHLKDFVPPRHDRERHHGLFTVAGLDLHCRCRTRRRRSQLVPLASENLTGLLAAMSVHVPPSKEPTRGTPPMHLVVQDASERLNVARGQRGIGLS
jgi:hypothetical protein